MESNMSRYAPHYSYSIVHVFANRESRPVISDNFRSMKRAVKELSETLYDIPTEAFKARVFARWWKALGWKTTMTIKTPDGKVRLTLMTIIREKAK